MRTFWALVAIIVFAAAAMWFTTAGAASHQAQSRARDEQQKSQRIAQELTSREQAARQQAASATPASDPAPPSDPAPTDANPPSLAETPAAPPPLTGKAEDTSETASAHTDPDTPLASTSAVESPRPEPLPEPSPDPAPATSREPDPSSAPATPAETSPAESKPAETGPIPAKIERLDNGNLKVDGRFTVKGDGSQENPYEVSWDHLISVSELYNPRDGKKRLPERVTMLDGKFVRLTGYVAFPMYVDKPRELLSMLNQWDGCCIGVPPTPFDAVEVRLKAAVEGSDRYATQGEVTGKFGVKPYLAGDWLVGLFVMDDAQFTTRSTAGSTRN